MNHISTIVMVEVSINIDSNNLQVFTIVFFPMDSDHYDRVACTLRAKRDDRNVAYSSPKQ